MPKSPFERVFSLIERKKLLQRLVQARSRVLVRNSSNEMLEFRPIDIDASMNIKGEFSQSSPKDFERVTVLFYVDRERYFFTTQVKKKGDAWILLNDPQLFKLNRRNAFRVRVPVSIELSFYVSTIRNIEFNRKVSVVEFSSSGARIHWPGEKRLSKGTQLKGYLQWGKGRVLPIEGSVVHSPEPGIYGVRFVNLNTISQNRLKMLSLELQQIGHS
jgi:c-di-GMP-binding flagellar brake protein YcgR